MEMTNETLKSIGCYRIKLKMADVECGIVCLAEHQLTKQKVTIKILHKQKLQRELKLKHLAREIAILKKVRHFTIAQLYEIIETNQHVYIVFEHIEGILLSDYLQQKKKLKQSTASKIFYEIIHALEYLRKMHIVHNNIKTTSIYILQQCHIKIVNFQESKQVVQTNLNKKNNQSALKQVLPETQKGNIYFGDLLAAAHILYQMLCGIPAIIRKSNLKSSPDKIILPENLSYNASNILLLLLSKNRQTKLTIQTLKSHPFICKNETSIAGKTSDQELLEETVMRQLELFGIQKKYALKCILKNQCNYVTTLYWLLKKKNQNQYVQKTNSPKMSRSPVLGSLNNIKEGKKIKYKHNPESTKTIQQKTHTNRQKGKKISQQKKKYSSESKKKQKQVKKKLTLYSIITDRRKSEASDSKRQKKNVNIKDNDYFEGAKQLQKKHSQMIKIRQSE